MKTQIDYTETCYCGKPLHYRNPEYEKIMRHIVKTQGPMIRVTVIDRTWLVPRHFIALHGIAGKDLAKLGFEEVTTPHEVERPADKQPEEIA